MSQHPLHWQAGSLSGSNTAQSILQRRTPEAGGYGEKHTKFMKEATGKNG